AVAAAGVRRVDAGARGRRPRRVRRRVVRRRRRPDRARARGRAGPLQHSRRRRLHRRLPARVHSRVRAPGLTRTVGLAWCHRRMPPARPAYRLVRPAVAPSAAPALDAEQRAVVAHAAGPLLVLAGPGTGKTTTLVESVVSRVAGGIDP